MKLLLARQSERDFQSSLVITHCACSIVADLQLGPSRQQRAKHLWNELSALDQPL
jgi:hypothetical protein